jgi:hypothetical protein
VTLPPPISPVNLNLEFGASIKKETNILRYESDTLKVCEPKLVRTQRYLGVVGEITWIVHILKKGKVKSTRLN